MQVWLQLAVIGFAGACGALSRYGLSVWMKHLFGDHFPIGTLLVNLIGCFLLGLLNEWFDEIGNRDLRLILGVGFLGALTTFSTFGVETFSKFQQGQPLLALTNVAANLLLGLAMAAAGFYVGKWLGGSHSMI